MKRYILALSLIVTCVSALAAQTTSNGKQGDKPAVDNSAFVETAKSALAAHGGDKLRQMRSLVTSGAVDIVPTPSQVIPATFVLAMAGEKYLFELNNPLQPLKQVYDGRQLYSSGYQLPPMTSLGFPLLPKIGEAGYVIGPPAEGKKKRKGFRITTPDGYYTDFFIDEKTGQIKWYESAYEVMGRTATTAVEIDEMVVVEGITVPKKYSQRFDMGPITAYANFKTKDVVVNKPIADDLFAIPR